MAAITSKITNCSVDPIITWVTDVITVKYTGNFRTTDYCSKYIYWEIIALKNIKKTHPIRLITATHTLYIYKE